MKRGLYSDPKAGRHSVGVGRQYVAGLGRVLDCQQNAGVWLASEDASYPVDWQLALPDSWVTDAEQRGRAAVPDHIRPQTPMHCAIESVVAMTEEWRLTPRPLVMTVSDADLPEVATTFTARRIPFVLRVEGSLPLVVAGTRLASGCGRVFPASRLIDNAVDAMDGRGTLTLRTRAEGGCVIVEIGDTGCGIPADSLARIFEPFHTTKDVGKGTGLGLHLSYQIVTQRHRGSIIARLIPGETWIGTLVVRNGKIWRQTAAFNTPPAPENRRRPAGG